MTADALTTTPHTVAPVSPAEKPRLAARFPALDGLRGIAVLLVMVFHYCSPLYEKGTLFSRLIYKLTHFGWCGVDLFFVLSGFLITGILYDSKQSTRYFRNFYIRRTLRIFPLYYGVLIVSFVLIPLFHPYTLPEDSVVVAHQWSLWLYCTNIDTALVHNWVQNGEHLNMSHFWSLSVEEQFYLFWPFIVLWCNRRALIITSAACILGAFALRCYYVCIAGDTLSPYVLTPCRMDALAWGALAAAVARGPNGPLALKQFAKWVLLFAGLGLFIIIAKLRYFSPARDIVVTAGFSLLAAFFAGIIAAAVLSTDRGWFGKFCRIRFLTFTGSLAYGLYVFHYLFFPFITKLLPLFNSRLPASLAAVAYLASAIFISFAMAAISWYGYEKHFLRLKDRLAPTRVRP